MNIQYMYSFFKQENVSYKDITEVDIFSALWLHEYIFLILYVLGWIKDDWCQYEIAYFSQAY